ncbi:MAG: hypothetical protein ACLP5H_34205 [Desulfomonilaceae bacterium]
MREDWPPDWNQESIDRLESNQLWQEYAATHPMRPGGRDLDDVRAFAETIIDKRIPRSTGESDSDSSDKIISSPA